MDKRLSNKSKSEPVTPKPDQTFDRSSSEDSGKTVLFPGAAMGPDLFPVPTRPIAGSPAAESPAAGSPVNVKKEEVSPMSPAMMPVKKEVMNPTSPAMPDETETRDDAAGSGTLAAEEGSSAKVVPREAGDMNVVVVTTPENGSGQPRIDKKRKKIRKKKKTVATPDEPLAERLGQERHGHDWPRVDQHEALPAFSKCKRKHIPMVWSQDGFILLQVAGKVNDLMTQVLTEFRSKPDDAQEFSQEMTLVQKRQEWLVAALSLDDSALATKISEQEAASRTHPGDGATVTDSRDGGALARAGPCAGFENLKSLNFLESQAPKFRACSSQADIKQTMESITPSKKLIMMLASACKTAVNELAVYQPAATTELASSMAASTFGLATSQVSVGKFEVNMFPSIRLTYQGSRFVTVILLDGVLDMLSQPAKSGSAEDRPSVNLQQVQEWAFNATQADVEKLFQANKAFAGTVGSADLIYLPPGCLVSHRVHSGDVLGIRCGVLGPEMEDGLTSISKLRPANMCVQQAISFLKSQTPPPPQETKGEGPPQERKEDG
eukprot:symbB.v1.2.040356.t1/scaffold7167.1/size12942/3